MSKSERLAGKVAVVTGAGAKDGIGIGAAIAIRLAREGACVVVVNRSAGPCESTLSAIRAEGGTCIGVLADIAIGEDCLRAAKEAVSAYGQVDILVNNAAISRGGSIVEGTDEVWDSVMDVNLKGTMMISRSIIPHMPRDGSIINISSRSGVLPPARGGVAYSTSKGALISLTRVMAVQLGSRGIRANVLLVGNCWTPMARRAITAGLSAREVELLRLRRRMAVLLESEGTPWDAADAALFFASQESRWVTGQALAVDGGYMLAGDPADPAYDRGKAQLLD